jgi:hypothetical protein
LIPSRGGPAGSEDVPVPNVRRMVGGQRFKPPSARFQGTVMKAVFAITVTGGGASSAMLSGGGLRLGAAVNVYQATSRWSVVGGDSGMDPRRRLSVNPRRDQTARSADPRVQRASGYGGSAPWSSNPSSGLARGTERKTAYKSAKGRRPVPGIQNPINPTT